MYVTGEQAIVILLGMIAVFGLIFAVVITIQDNSRKLQSHPKLAK
jgi:hypothetical protein